ncbi:MAG: peptidoglycan DD-metalloendopeptidase family protein, partial [Anaerolineales bacterium]
VLPSPKGTTPAIVTLTPQATPTALAPAASATALPEPTLTPAPLPSPSPTAIMTAISEATPTQLYTTQSGDTLPALAARFGVNPNDIVAPAGLTGSTTLEEGQLLVIPDVLSEVGPGEKLIPDSELVYSGGGAGFDPQQFAADQGGYLARYKGFADALTRNGGGLVLLVAQHQAINPRLLTALLEYQGGWITNPQPAGDALTYPLGYQHPYRRDLYHQLSWAAVQLATGYYGWRAGSLTELHFPDGSTLRLDPTLNAGTVALHYYFAQFLNRPEWDEAISTSGLRATYERLFGDPFARAVDPLIPAELTQPELRLPFLPGHTWSFSGGPHGAWERGGAQAALDFAPGSVTNGCGESDEWVTAVAAGKVVRVDYGSVLLDLDGDGREATGWVILYLHVAAKDRVKEGAFVEAGARIGHPSCEGGQATGTHVHIARKYNGEWILADGVIPFDLEGWVAHQGEAEYKGTLTRGDQVIPACTCTAAWTGITAGQ